MSTNKGIFYFSSRTLKKINKVTMQDENIIISMFGFNLGRGTFFILFFFLFITSQNHIQKCTIAAM